MTTPPQPSRLARWSLILGIRALIKRDPQRGMAIAGLVFSLACLI